MGGEVVGFEDEAGGAVGIFEWAVEELVQVEVVGGGGEALVFSFRTVDEFVFLRLETRCSCALSSVICSFARS